VNFAIFLDIPGYGWRRKRALKGNIEAGYNNDLSNAVADKNKSKWRV
jgi:hypothetical protein